MNIVELAPDMPVGFRDGVTGDMPFIFSSWLRGHHRAGDWPRRLGIPNCAWAAGDTIPCRCCKFSHRRYFDEHKKVVARLLERSKVLVACNPANESQVLGYIVYEPGVLHWVMVKEPFRWDRDAEHHPRIGSALFKQAFPDSLNIGAKYTEEVILMACSHWTMNAERLADKWGLVYRPFLLEEQ